MTSVFVTACSSSEAGQLNGPKGISQEESQVIARQYVVDDPTFQFDGMMDTLTLVATITLKCPYCWEFVYQFDCGRAGYGNRTGLMLAQVITPHTTRIVVQEGMVTSAMMDGSWDMVGQKFTGNNSN